MNINTGDELTEGGVLGVDDGLVGHCRFRSGKSCEGCKLGSCSSSSSEASSGERPGQAASDWQRHGKMNLLYRSLEVNWMVPRAEG